MLLSSHRFPEHFSAHDAGLQIGCNRALLGSRNRWSFGDDNSRYRWMVHTEREVWSEYLQNSLLGLWMCPLCRPQIGRVIQFYPQYCPPGFVFLFLGTSINDSWTPELWLRRAYQLRSNAFQLVTICAYLDLLIFPYFIKYPVRADESWLDFRRN